MTTSTPRTTRRTVLRASAVAAASLAGVPAGRSRLTAAGALQDRPTTIEYYYSEGSSVGQSIAALVKLFEQANPAVKVEPRSYTVYSEVVQALQAALAAGNPPAVAQIGYDLLRYAVANLPHLPVGEAVTMEEADAAYLTDSFPSSVLALGQIDGVQHGLPMIIGSPYLLYNDDLMKKVGLTSAPASWTDVRSYAERLTAEAGVVGFVMPTSGDFWHHQGLIESNGAHVLVQEGDTFRTGIASPEAIEAVQLNADMVLGDKSAIHTDWGQAIASFTAGQIGMLMGSGGTVINVLQNASFALGTARFPTFGDKPRRVPVGGSSNMIFATEADQQAAGWAFLKFLHSPEATTIWIEGTGYVPPTSGVADDPAYLKPFFDSMPLLRPELEQQPDYVPWVSWPGTRGLEASKVVSDALQRIMTGEADVAPALSDAAAEIDALISS